MIFFRYYFEIPTLNSKVIILTFVDDDPSEIFHARLSFEDSDCAVQRRPGSLTRCVLLFVAARHCSYPMPPTPAHAAVRVVWHQPSSTPDSPVGPPGLPRGTRRTCLAWGGVAEGHPQHPVARRLCAPMRVISVTYVDGYESNAVSAKKCCACVCVSVCVCVCVCVCV